MRAKLRGRERGEESGMEDLIIVVAMKRENSLKYLSSDLMWRVAYLCRFTTLT